MTQSRVLAILWAATTVLLALVAAWGLVIFVDALTATHRPHQAMLELTMFIGLVMLAGCSLPAWVGARLTLLLWSLHASPTLHQRALGRRLSVRLILVFVPVLLLVVLVLFGLELPLRPRIVLPLLFMAALVAFTFLHLARVVKSAPASP